MASRNLGVLDIAGEHGAISQVQIPVKRHGMTWDGPA